MLLGYFALVAAKATILAASPVKPADDWTREGPALAGKVIDQCLSTANGPFQARLKCVRAAFDRCESQHGSESQHDLTDCAVYSSTAWRKRVEAVVGRLKRAMHAGDRTALAGHFAQSNLRWGEWNEGDCKMQSSIHAGGSLEPFDLELCLSDHTAVRAIELSDFLEDVSR